MPFSTSSAASSAPTSSRLAHDPLDVERHADADEEESEQEALERLDLRFDLVAVFRIGEQHAGEERAERHRDADEIHEPRRADHDQQRGRREHFGRAGARSRAEHRTQQIAAADDDDRDRDDHAQRRERTRAGVRRRMRHRERRDQREDRDRGDVLEQQDREAEPAVRGWPAPCARRGSADRSPSTTAQGRGRRSRRPSSRGRARTRCRRSRAPVTTSCRLPMPNTVRRMTHRRCGESSRPITNSISTTPSSDSWLICSVLPIRRDAGRPDQRADSEIAEHRAELPALGQRHRDDGREQEHDRVLKKTMGLHASSVHRLWHARSRSSARSGPGCDGLRR